MAIFTTATSAPSAKTSSDSQGPAQLRAGLFCVRSHGNDTGAIVSDQTERLDQVLPDAAARRLSNQIARAYRGTYGARTGLRTIVRSVARQMLNAGSPPEVVSRVIER